MYDKQSLLLILLNASLQNCSGDDVDKLILSLDRKTDFTCA